MLTCKDAIHLMCDFLDSILGPEAARELEAHLDRCEPCVAYLNTYRKTQELTGAAAREEMPAEMKVRLRNFLLEQLSKLEP
jgi:anti-sigma factor RsiW